MQGASQRGNGVAFLEASGVIGNGFGVSGGMEYSQRSLEGCEVGVAGSGWRWVLGGVGAKECGRKDCMSSGNAW